MDSNPPKPPGDVASPKDAREASAELLSRAGPPGKKPRPVGTMMLRVVLIYVAVAALWILVSDRLVRVLVADEEMRTTVSMAKGWAFVLVTGILLHLLLRREARYWTEERRARKEAEAAQRLQNERQRLLLEASRLASEATGSEHELSLALMQIVEPLIQAEGCFHYRLEADGEHLDLIGGIGLPPRHSQLIQRLPLENSFAGSAAIEKRMLVVEDRQMQSDERGAIERLMGLRAYAVFPLLARGGRVLGTLAFGRYKRGAFSTEEVELLQIVCRFASLATERLRTLAVLRHSEEQLRLFIEHAPAALAMFDREMRYLAASRRWLDDFGLQGRPVVGLSYYAVFPEIPQHWREVHRRALGGEVISSDSDPFVRPDGSTQWLRWEVRPWRDAQGQIGGISVLSEDISSKVESDIALRESEARYRLLAENTADVIWVLDVAAQRFTYVSPSVQRLRGYTVEEVMAQTLEQAVTADSLSTIARELPVRLAGFAAGDPKAVTQIHEIEQPRKDGSTVWTEIVTTLVKNSTGGLQLVGVSRDIAERRKMEAALHASEAQSRAVVESAPDAIFIQTGGEFAYLNPAAVRLFGAASAEELVGKPVLDCVHPDFREKARQRIRQLNERRESATVTVQRFVSLDGRVVDAETSGVPFTHRGEPGALVFARDVTERKRTEERMHFQQAVLEETGKIAQVGGWSFDPATGEGYWTDEVARIHDLPTDGPIDMKKGLQHYQGESRRKIEEAIKRAVELGESYDLELELTTAKGNRKWVRTIGHPLVENGRVVRVRGSFQDITARKLAEQALRESEERFRQVVENIEEVFWVTDPEKNAVLYLSPAYEKIWGRTAASALASPRSWLEAIHEDDRERVLEAATTKQVRGDYAETYRVKRPDGTTRWILDRAFPVRDADGRVYRVVGTATDITEHRKLENQVRQTQKMEAIGTLAGGIAHDFNNILGAISGYAELAKMDPSRETIDASLAEILKASKRAGDLVRQILAFSRQQEQKRVPIQLWRVVDEAVRLLRAALPSTIKFEIDLAKEAPTVLADATQIHQVVMNLCTNAAHAMADRPGLLQVKLVPFEMDEEFARAHPGAKAGLHARLEIKDNGHGMDQGTLERIFEPFFTTKAPGEGTGLGLSVVHGIVRNHEGIITVYSRPGQGTVFHVYFPAHHRDEALPEVSSEQLPRGNGERVLIVDDEAQLVQMLAAMLGKLGYLVETSTQPVLALQKATAAHTAYDLVMTDLTMPEMTGTEFVAHLLLASPSTKIVLMTGFMTKQNQEQVARLGVREILFKPVTVRALAETISRVLKG